MAKQNSEERGFDTPKISRVLVLIFFLALVIRGLILAENPNKFLFSTTTFRSATMALNFLRGNGFSISGLPPISDPRVDPIEFKDKFVPTTPYYDALDMPGHAALLALTWKIFGEERYIYSQVIQVILDSLLVFIVYWISMRIFRKESFALFSALLFACFFPEALASAVAVRDFWAIFFTIVPTALLLKSKDVRTTSRQLFLYTLIGILLGLGIYIHALIQYLGIFLTIGLVFYHNKRAAALFFVTAHLAILIILSPWIVRNYKLYHIFVPTRLVFWQCLWEGWGEFKDNPMGSVFDDGETYRQAQREGFQGEFGDLDYHNFLKAKSLRALREYPRWIASAVVRRLYFVVFPDYVVTPITYSPDFLEKSGQATKSLSIDTIASYPIDSIKKVVNVIVKVFLRFSLPILFGIAIYMHRKRWREFAVVAIVPLYFASALAPLHVEARYVLPVYFVYFIFAAPPLAWVYNKVTNSLRATRAKRDPSK